MYTSWETLKKECMSCTRCRLCESRTNIVFGGGNENAEVLFIGEGPGKQEDLTGEPFVGRCGQLLDKYLSAVDLDRKTDIYIANMVKCRPPQNRDPKQDEQDECIKWLCEQVRIMRPKIIVCLGRIAAQRLISPDFKVTLDHGVFEQKGGIFMMGTFHPASLLRNQKQRPQALEDFLKLRDKMREVCGKNYNFS
jgi:uracil-DNA glycosylase family 4